jgi:putative hemolysin
MPLKRHYTSEMLSDGFSQLLSTVMPIALPKPVGRALAGAIGLRQLEILYQELAAAADTRAIWSRLLKKLQIRYRVSEKDIAQIPGSGPTIVIANHPFGILDGAILSELLLPIRTDVKFLANGILDIIPEIRNLMIAVDPLNGASATGRNLQGLRRAYRHLAGGGLLVIFPAGEVSHFQWSRRAVEDSEWNGVVSRLATAASRRDRDITIVPLHIDGANSVFFQTAGLLHSRLRTVLLGRELINKHGREISIRVGAPTSSARLAEMGSERDRTEYLRWRTYLLGHGNQYKPKTSLPMWRKRNKSEDQPAPPVSQTALCDEIAVLGPSNLLASSNELQVFIASAAQISMILNEIGRLRELTFRAAGEGTGKSTDIDSFDGYYQHLFVWNCRKREVVGAYRLVGTDVVRSRFGKKGLYTATLFNCSDQFLDQIDPALELGRSFIRPEYQRTFAPLLLLWKAIGRYLAEHPRYKILFGPVTISNAYQSISRELMVSWLERRASFATLKHLVSSKRPLHVKSNARDRWISGIDDLSKIIEDMEPNQRGVPVLLRQYLKLGGKLLSFNIDPEFSNALDGLIMVDLTQTDVKILERYLGRTEANAFLNFHRGNLVWT